MLSKERRDFLWTVGALAVLILVAVFGAYSGMHSQPPTNTPSVTAESRFNNAAKGETMPQDFWLVAFTGLLVAVTGLLVFVGVLQHRQLKRTNVSAAIVERAYVKLSHHPPGLTIEEASGLFWVKVRVKNHGRTPARITDVLLKPQLLPNGEPLSVNPDYQRTRDEPSKAFLVAEDEFSHSEVFEMGPDNVSGVKDGTTKLWLYGYVDYIDMFGQRFRAGYARVYEPQNDKREYYGSDEDFEKRSNLVFVTQDGYNYDRSRKEDEGKDW